MRIADWDAPAVYSDAESSNALWFAFSWDGKPLDALDQNSISLLFKCLSDKGLANLGAKLIENAQQRRNTADRSRMKIKEP